MPDSDPDPRLCVDIIRRSGKWAETVASDDLIARAARSAYAAAASPRRAHEVSIVLTDDAEQRRLNRAYRGKDAATNVLSFPAEHPGESIAPPLGDVVLAYETVMRESEADAKAAGAHVAHLVIHGVLHLLGHDHQADKDADAMEAIETRVMTALGYADPYAEHEAAR